MARRFAVLRRSCVGWGSCATSSKWLKRVQRRAEILNFIAKIKEIFEQWQIAEFFETPRRLGVLGHTAEKEAHEVFRSQLDESEKLREDAAKAVTHVLRKEGDRRIAVGLRSVFPYGGLAIRMGNETPKTENGYAVTRRKLYEFFLYERTRKTEAAFWRKPERDSPLILGGLGGRRNGMSSVADFV